MIIRSIIANLGIFRGDNNIRRNLSALSYNWLLPKGYVDNAVNDLQPGQTMTINLANTATAVTFIRTSSPVQAQVNLLPNSAVGRATGATITVAVTSLLALDDTVGAVVLTNASTTATATIQCVQGS